jgi:hypothetical protein
MRVHVFIRKPNSFICPAGALSRGCPPRGFFCQEGPASPSVSGVKEAFYLSSFPDIGRELPVASDLLPHHDTFAVTSCGVGALVLRLKVSIFARRRAMRSSGERSAGQGLCRPETNQAYIGGVMPSRRPVGSIGDALYTGPKKSFRNSAEIRAR